MLNTTRTQILAAGLVLAAPLLACGQDAAEPAPGAPASGTGGGPTVTYEGREMSLKALHELYVENRAQMEALVAQGKQAQDKVLAVAADLQTVQNQQSQKQAPIEKELVLARNKMRAAASALRRLRPPTKPGLLKIPPKPGRSAFYDRDDYEEALDRWEDQAERVEKENEKRKKQYEQDKEKYESGKREAEQEMAKCEQEIAARQEQIDAIEKDFDVLKAPHIEKQRAAIEEKESLARRAQALIVREQEMAKAFRSVPRAACWRLGIVEWDGRFRRIEDLQAHYERIQGEVDRVRKELEASAERSGTAFPEDWRHPQQDEMDRLKALLDEAKAIASP